MKLSSSNASADEPEINLVSLIDVVFCIIIFLVVSTTFDTRSALKLTLPRVESSAPLEAVEPLVVVVDAEGRFFVGANEVLRRDGAALREAIAEVAGADRARQVVVRADARAETQATMTALDALTQLGFERVSFATMPAEAAE